jgi:hypothetical protein
LSETNYTGSLFFLVLTKQNGREALIVRLASEPQSILAFLPVKHSEILMARLEGIKEEVQAIINATGASSLTLGVLHEGTVLHTSSYGLRDRERNLPPNDLMLYNMASISKSYLAAAAGILVSEGLFDCERQSRRTYQSSIRLMIPTSGSTQTSLTSCVTLPECPT